jgi:ATP-binding cassette subfamily B protein
MGRPQRLKESVPSLLRIFRHFWPWIRPERKLILGSMTALFAGVGLRLLEPWPLKFIFDGVIAAYGGSVRLGVLDRFDPLTILTFAVIGIVAISGLRAVTEYWETIGFAKIGNRVLRHVRDDLYRHVQGLSLSFHTRARSGDLIVRVTRDVSMVRDVTSTAILPLIASLLILVGMAAMMAWLQWQLALLAFATVPLFWFTTVRIGRRIRDAARKQREREGAMASIAAESITAIKIIQTLSLEAVFADAFSGRNEQSQKEDLKAARLSARLERSVDVLLAVATAMVLWFGARLVLRSELTPGDLLVFVTYLKRALTPAKDFAKYSGRLAKAAAAGERVLDVLQRVPEIRDLPDAVPAPALQGRIRFDAVTFAYEPGREVLRQVDFEIEPGQYVALVGPSGIGKSTLTSLLLRLYDPTQGQVLIDGRDIRQYTLASLRSQMSVVLQDSILFAAKVSENIGYGAREVTPGEIEAAARLANAHEFITELPEGYDTVLGERGVTLSHGQRQRIAIARAAVRRSPILILDEPTTGLDEENERAVTEALIRLASGRTTLLITHNLQLASRAHVVFYLENARLIECGAPADLMRADGRYATLYRSQCATSV